LNSKEELSELVIKKKKKKKNEEELSELSLLFRNINDFGGLLGTF
jgi:hypothetical protein